MVAVKDSSQELRKPMFSQQWYRVADLKPRLVQHVHISRQTFRGQEWFILRHHLEGRFHRIPRSAYALVQQMNGHRTMDEIWKSVCLAMPDQAPTQDDIVDLLGRLYQQNLILSDKMPDIAELQKRFTKQRRSKWQQQIKNPMAIRIPLWNPERFLQKTLFMTHIFSFPGLIIWLLMMVYLLINVGIYWPELSQNFSDRVLAADNLVLMAVIYPFIKLLHEMSHAYAVKRWRGQVNEMGLMFLIFIPIPYVNASASITFENKYRRMIVGMAGIMTELAIASVALWIWIHTSDPLIHSFAYNALLITGVSTVLFNGNPLLRFDGYYSFADWLEIPNLYQRSQQYIGYLYGRYLMGLKDSVFHSAKGERPWFFSYAIAAWIYRVFISLGIALFVAQEFFIVGMILAAITLYGLLLKPVINQLQQLFTKSKYQGKRMRILAITGGIVGLLMAFIFLVPMPYRTVIQGVTWAPEASHIRAGSEGWFEQLQQSSGTQVDKDQALMRLSNSEIEADRQDYLGKIKVLETRLQRAKSRDRSEGPIILQELEHARTVLEEIEFRIDHLMIKAPREGQWLAMNSDQLQGRYIQRGELLGYVLQPNDLTIKAVADQAAINAIRQNVTKIELRPASNIDKIIPATLKRQIPEASKIVPHLALTSTGGGDFEIDPAFTEQGSSGTVEAVRTFENLFQLEFSTQEPSSLRLGERVYIRLQHKDEPLFWRWWRDLRRVFLAELDL
jgi:putative peptide zinc metalloprotease protein